MNVVETEPGVYSVLLDGASYEVRVLGTQVTVNGYRFEPKRQSATAAAHGPISITAPMPGKIVRILAAVGDEVKAAQAVVVVEAMKMQNELKSPRDGRITAIRVQPGDSVNAGVVLLTIE